MVKKVTFLRSIPQKTPKLSRFRPNEWYHVIQRQILRMATERFFNFSKMTQLPNPPPLIYIKPNII